MKRPIFIGGGITRFVMMCVSSASAYLTAKVTVGLTVAQRVIDGHSLSEQRTRGEAHGVSLAQPHPHQYVRRALSWISRSDPIAVSYSIISAMRNSYRPTETARTRLAAINQLTNGIFVVALCPTVSTAIHTHRISGSGLKRSWSCTPRRIPR